MAEKDSWGLTEEEKRERLREINQNNAKRGPTRGGRSSGQGVKLLYIRDYLYAHATNRDNPKRYSKSGNVYIVSPYALLWDNGNYYLYAYTGKGNFHSFRIDRMENISHPLMAEREGGEGVQCQPNHKQRIQGIPDVSRRPDESSCALLQPFS